MNALIPRLVCFVVLAAGFSGARAAPIEHVGRGIYHFASQSGCPFEDAAQTQCNRLTLDMQDVSASIDTDAHVITFISAANHEADDVLGDVLLQGSGVSDKGLRVPLSVMVMLHRDGASWKTDVYARAPVTGKFTDVKLDPYHIRGRTGEVAGSERDLLTPEDARKLFEHPSFAARLARHLVKVKPTDSAQPNNGDITISLGVGALSKAVARARFTSGGVHDANIDHLLSSGAWSIQIDALSNHIPAWTTRRELFLFGLDGRPILEDLHAHGFRKNDHLEFGMRDGQGYLRFNGQEEAFPGAAASGRSFMQESFIGLILGWNKR